MYSNHKKYHKPISILVIIILLSFMFSINTYAASTTWNLYKTQTESKSNTLGLYKKGRIDHLSNNPGSNDGVNLYLEYSIPGEGWKQAQHVFAEPGYRVSATTYYTASSKSSWRGKMNSWWIGGKNCSAGGGITATN